MDYLVLLLAVLSIVLALILITRDLSTQLTAISFEVKEIRERLESTRASLEALQQTTQTIFNELWPRL